MGLFSSKKAPQQVSEEDFPDLLNLLHSKEGADIILNCDNKTFPVHSNVLESHSDAFKAIFDSVGRSKTVKIDDMPPDLLQHMLHFLYSGTLQPLTMHYALKLFQAARTYEIIPLEKKCLQLLKDGMKEEHVLDILNFSDSKRIGEVKDIAIAYIIKNKKFLLSERWRFFAEKNQNIANDILVAIARNTE